MLKALVVLLWPVGIGAILAVTALLAKRPVRSLSPATAPMNGHNDSDAVVNSRAARSSIIGLLLILSVGAVAVYALTALLGMLVVHAGPSIDKPIYYWMIHHRVHFWKSVMNRVTKVGDTWTTWGAAVAAAVCLAAFYRRQKWLPAVVRRSRCGIPLSASVPRTVHSARSPPADAIASSSSTGSSPTSSGAR